MSAPVMVLPVNTKRETGRAAQLGNITAAKAVADIIRTTLGPRWVNDALDTNLFFVNQCLFLFVYSLTAIPSQGLVRLSYDSPYGQYNNLRVSIKITRKSATRP